MIVKKPEQPLPANKVLFKVPVQYVHYSILSMNFFLIEKKTNFNCPNRMTGYDVKNYLEKIYKIPVMQVKTRVVCGEIKRAKSTKPYLIKEDDYREAIVDLVMIIVFLNTKFKLKIIFSILCYSAKTCSIRIS